LIFKTKTKSQKLRRALLREEERIAIREALRNNRKHHHQQVASEPIIHHPGNIDQSAGPPPHRIFIPRRDMFPGASDHHHHQMNFATEGPYYRDHFRSSPAQQVPHYADHFEDSNKDDHQSAYNRVRPSSSDQFDDKSIKEIELNEYHRRRQMVNDLVKICKAIPLTVEMANPLINFNGWPNNTITQHQ